MNDDELHSLIGELSPRESSPSQAGRRPVNISVAIPIYNEVDTLPVLHRRLAAVLDELSGQHEILFVNDGSRDGSDEVLSALAVCDPRVRVIHLSRNWGHQAALSAAFDHVRGDVMILMDGDLQDTPETIPRFVSEYQRGFDVVYAIRSRRKESWLLRTAYAGFYWLIARISNITLPEGAGDFGLLSARVVRTIRNCPERHRYLRGLRSWAGFRQQGIIVERDARFAGESKYSWIKLFRLAFDGIFAFSAVPLRAATWLGAATIAAALAFTVVATISHLFFARSPQGFTALITAITFLAGVQLLFLGVIGEYVGRIYEQVKQRPLYLVDRIESLDGDTTREHAGPGSRSRSDGFHGAPRDARDYVSAR
jgi:dolichol-phosphate mannosyltransferase